MNIREEIVTLACIAYNQVLLNQSEDNRDQTKAMHAALSVFANPSDELVGRCAIAFLAEHYDWHSDGGEYREWWDAMPGDAQVRALKGIRAVLAAAVGEQPK